MPKQALSKKGLSFTPKIKAISFKGLTDRGLAGVRVKISFTQSAG